MKKTLTLSTTETAHTQITVVEFIDKDGKKIVYRGISTVKLSLSNDGKTLKIIKNKN